MEDILSLLNNYQPTQIYSVLFILFLISGLGIFPNSTDINLLILGSLIAQGKLSFILVWPTCATALLISDSIVFFLTKILFDHIHRFKHVKKFWKSQFKKNLEHLIKNNLFLSLLCIRMAPTARQPMIILLSSLGTDWKKWYPFHIPILYAHNAFLLSGSYFINRYFSTYFEKFKWGGLIAALCLWGLLITILVKIYKHQSKSLSSQIS
jgi:membrane protein DedA with SNARE-associated domain